MYKESFILPDGTIRNSNIPIDQMMVNYDRLKLPDLENKKVLHLNCGEGFNTIKMKQSGATVHCLTDVQQNINILLDNFKIFGYENDIVFYDIKISDLHTIGSHKFDIVVYEKMFMYILDINQAMQKIHDKCNPNTLFVGTSIVDLSDITFPYIKYVFDYEYRFVPNLECLQYLISMENRFENIKMININKNKVIIHAQRI